MMTIFKSMLLLSRYWILLIFSHVFFFHIISIWCNIFFYWTLSISPYLFVVLFFTVLFFQSVTMLLLLSVFSGQFPGCVVWTTLLWPCQEPSVWADLSGGELMSKVKCQMWKVCVCWLVKVTKDQKSSHYIEQVYHCPMFCISHSIVWYVA